MNQHQQGGAPSAVIAFTHEGRAHIAVVPDVTFDVNHELGEPSTLTITAAPDYVMARSDEDGSSDAQLVSAFLKVADVLAKQIRSAREDRSEARKEWFRRELDRNAELRKARREAYFDGFNDGIRGNAPNPPDADDDETDSDEGQEDQ